MSALTLAPEVNLLAAWLGILLGMLGGAAAGLFFHRRDWLGGYDGWRRRLLRLGHVSFFGLAFVNLAFALTADRLAPVADPAAPGVAALATASWLFVVGAAAMPMVCFLAAWRKPARHAFFVPVLAELAGVGLVVFALIDGMKG